MDFKELNRADLPLIKEIVELEEEAFGGKGGVDLWILKALLRYGKVFVLEEDNKIISIIEYMQCFDKKEVFLYGICTLKKYRNQGNANRIMAESEKYLKIKVIMKYILLLILKMKLLLICINILDTQ